MLRTRALVESREGVFGRGGESGLGAERAYCFRLVLSGEATSALGWIRKSLAGCDNPRPLNEGSVGLQHIWRRDVDKVKRSEKGLLTPDNCMVALVDLQPQMLFGVKNFDTQTVVNNNQILAKAARLFEMPVVISTVETKTFSGRLWPQIEAVFPDLTPIERSLMNAWDDANFVAAVKATGRRKIVFAGLWTETCVALPAIQAIYDGYEVYVVEDCCGDLSSLAHTNAMARVVQAGAKPVTALSVLLEWQRDWGLKDTYDGVMDIVKTHCGAYGMGVEYAYTMVHDAPPTVWPRFQPR